MFNIGVIFVRELRLKPDGGFCQCLIEGCLTIWMR